jgi:Rieske Fe-S protein
MPRGCEVELNFASPDRRLRCHTHGAIFSKDQGELVCHQSVVDRDGEEPYA